MQDLSHTLFTIDLIILVSLLAGAVWSVVLPHRRIWPPHQRGSWRHFLTWACFLGVFGLNTALLVLDWDSWIFASNLRLIIGGPTALLGGFLVTWGVVVLGATNTSGLKGGLVSAGPYRFTRNPQYLGDIILFVGLSVVANSMLLWIAHALLILVFVIAPMAEEPWLEEQYGEAYREYRRGVPRFL